MSLSRRKSAYLGKKGTLPNAIDGIFDQIGASIRYGPNSTDEAAIGYLEDFGSGRVFVVDPWVKVFRDGEIVTEPSSACVAGLIAKIDNDKGFWSQRATP